MFGRKGQGALEYLLILAAVLAIAVVVILVAHSVATPAQTSSVVNQDKFACAQAGIELVNYNSLPTSANNVTVRYNGITSGPCSSDTSFTPSKYDAVCTIHFNNNKEHQLGVNQTSTTAISCGISS